jgi:hypothetical protein
LHAFTDLDRAANIEPYVAALEAFDALPQLQELIGYYLFSAQV